MYAYLKGTLVVATPEAVTLDVNGIGFLIHTPVSLYPHLPEVGKTFQFHTALIIRENSHTLFGFATPEERDLFLLLIEAKGVGPKLALGLIGHLPYAQLTAAIRQHDVHALNKVPGIGKKTAERLLIDLRDKIPLSAAYTPLPQDDALQALISLGYTQTQAQKAIQQTLPQLDAGVDTSTLITAALRAL